MKELWPLITAIAFFIVICTNNFWEGLLGFWIQLDIHLG